MICRDVREALDALLDGELEAGEEIEVREHLDWCSACGRDFEDLREWHGTLADALLVEGARPSVAERRRTADAVIAAIRRPAMPPPRWAADLAIGLSVGIVACAVALSRPPREQVARVAERIRERDSRGAELRAVSAEIERDLGHAQEFVAGRSQDDPAARAVLVASRNIARRLGEEPPGDAAPEDAGARVSISRSDNGDSISITQRNDGKIRVMLPDRVFEVRNMEELLSRYGDVCRRFRIEGADGVLALGDLSAGADWKGRLDLLGRTGAWDEAAQWDAYRGWVAARSRDAKEIERRLKAHQERCRVAAAKPVAPAATVDVRAILREVESLTRGQLRRTQEQVDAEMKKLEERLQEARGLQERARGLRIFAEDVSRD
jgi:anti-sigma factor RsiW